MTVLLGRNFSRRRTFVVWRQENLDYLGKIPIPWETAVWMPWVPWHPLKCSKGCQSPLLRRAIDKYMPKDPIFLKTSKFFAFWKCTFPALVVFFSWSAVHSKLWRRPCVLKSLLKTESKKKKEKMLKSKNVPLIKNPFNPIKLKGRQS